MREIKFRAWDGETNRMSKPFYIDDLKFGYIRDIDNCIMDKDLVLMQFTGIKDVKGSDIFEGDIIEFEFNGEIKTSVIKEHSKDYCYWMSLPMGKREFKVIGNIYENETIQS